MIRISGQHEAGVCVSIQVEGHALASEDRAYSIACAAVSSLLKSSAEAVVSIEADLEWDLQVSDEGLFGWRILHWQSDKQAILVGISKVLWLGLLSLAREFPESITIEERI